MRVKQDFPNDELRNEYPRDPIEIGDRAIREVFGDGDNEKRHHENPDTLNFHSKQGWECEKKECYEETDNESVRSFVTEDPKRPRFTNFLIRCKRVLPPLSYRWNQLTEPDSCYRKPDTDKKGKKIGETQMEITSNTLVLRSHTHLVFFDRCPECFNRTESSQDEEQ